jgi:nicotinate-nucleotide--dimethylbenzimidazole phosphoribosyltransferase
VGARPVPLSRRPPRPPIPIVRFDDAAAGAAGSELGAWLAGVRGRAGEPPVVRRIVVSGDAVPAAARGSALDVPQVALAVDAGRDLAAAAARDGVTVLIGEAPSGAGGAGLAALAAALTGAEPGHGPLGALRRHGDGVVAVLCGLALGSGEHGLGFVADGPAAVAGAAVAAGVEPTLRPRLRAGRPPQDATHAALLEHLGLHPGVDEAALLAAG